MHCATQAATRDMAEQLCNISAMFSGVGDVRLLPASLSGSRSADVKGGGLYSGGFEKLCEWVRECSAALEEAHPARDAEADRRGYCELYARHWLDKALDQQRGETEGRALGGTAVFYIQWWFVGTGLKYHPH